MMKELPWSHGGLCMEFTMTFTQITVNQTEV
jgi:hypothetical protein